MDILDMSALDLGKSIRKKEIGVVEAAKAYLEQIKNREPSINAYLDINEKNVYARAREVEKGIQKGIYTGPLAGVPIGVKDNICIKGSPVTCGSRMLENFVSPYDSTVALKLKEAGMVVLGKTNMDEFAMGSTTETSAFGVTRNPWDTRYVPGGSSGGSCAAVAARETPLALGSDTGGSIRQPSAFCGVTGLKPTYGRVSRYGLIAYASSLDQIGPIGRNTEDCAALLEVIAGKDEKDSTSVGGKDQEFVRGLCPRLQGLRIGVPREYLSQGSEDEIQKAIVETVTAMSKNGAQVEFFSLGMTEYVVPAYYILACAEASSNLARFDGVKYGYRTPHSQGLHDMYKKTRAEGFGKEAKRRILLGSFVLSAGYYDAYYRKALKAKNLIRQAFVRAFSKYDVILAPTAPHGAPKLGESLRDPVKMYLSDMYTVAVNLAGLPAVSLPVKLDEKGMPIGLQFIGNCFQEKKVLQAARGLEELRGAFPLPGRKEEG